MTTLPSTHKLPRSATAALLGTEARLLRSSSSHPCSLQECGPPGR